MKKIAVTSMMAILIATPSFATPSHTSSTFPEDEYMLEDYTYTGQATYANMGVYSGSVNVTADYTNNEYNVVAGTYLPAASETVTQCPANSFCPGLTGPTYYDANNAQGATACSTLTGGFSSSAAGSTANTDCYRACNISNMGSGGSIASIAHATALTGNDYYGAGTDTCEPTACENGYHVQAGLDLNTTIGTSGAGGYQCKSNSGTGMNSNYYEYGVTENGTFAVDYGTKGLIRGRAQCSSQSGTNNDWEWINPTISATLPDSSGQYCYCQLDSYTPVGGAAQSLPGSWVFRSGSESTSASFCANYCAFVCSDWLRDAGDASALAFRSAVFRASVVPATCEANTINITWNDASAADIEANDAGTATFGGDIRTPRAATIKPGKVFVGWTFVK